jgi:hypothetical protein
MAACWGLFVGSASGSAAFTSITSTIAGNERPPWPDVNEPRVLTPMILLGAE